MDGYHGSDGYHHAFLRMVYHPQDVPILTKDYRIKIDGNISHNWRTIVVGATFFLTILLWVCGKQLGVNANTVAMLPIAVLPLPAWLQPAT